MLLIAKMLYFVSGLIVLMTGVYVEVRFEQTMNEIWQLLVGGLALGYFVMQLVRLLNHEGRKKDTSAVMPEEFIA